MNLPKFSPPSYQTAVSSRDGCLSGFLIPPLAVISVGLMMAFFATRLSVRDSAAAPELTPIGSVTISTMNIFTPEVQWWSNDIHRWANMYSLDLNLIATVMQIESCGDPQARSSAGAMGLFQVMPFHFTSFENPYDPETNAMRGMGYLKRSLETAGGDFRLALAGYNGGISVIHRSEFTWASETQRYAYWGSGIYQAALRGDSESTVLQEWLASGGHSLCRAARLSLNLP